MKLEEIAKLAYETNRLFCIQIGDLSQISWKNAPSFQQDYYIDLVKKISNDIEFTAEEYHIEKVNNKKEKGWKFGKSFDLNKKEDPEIIEFENLPETIQTKEKITFALIKSLLPILEN